MYGLLTRLASRFRESATDTGASPESGDNATGHLAETFSTKREEFITLLNEHNGRMKQSAIVEATEWSPPTVSRVLSEMEEDNLVHKISVGRSNMIALVGAEPDWYTPPGRSVDIAGDRGPSAGAILLIEDDEHEVELLKRAFDEADIPNPIHTVRDGVDAVEFLMQRGQYADAPTPQLVLLDLQLLVVDGFDVLRELNDREGVPEYPIVVLSHSDAPRDVRRSYRAGATGYLTKPDDLDGLIALAEAIDGFWLSDHFQPPPMNK